LAPLDHDAVAVVALGALLYSAAVSSSLAQHSELQNLTSPEGLRAVHTLGLRWWSTMDREAPLRCTLQQLGLE
jgi:hypothetical protein